MTRPTSETVVSAVQKAIDAEEAVVHGILPTGESQHLRFYLVVWEIPHRDAGEGSVPEGATLLKERYFQIPKDSAPEEVAASGPQFKRNGIARRDTGDLKTRLVRLYARVSNGDGLDTDYEEPLWLGQEGEDKGGD